MFCNKCGHKNPTGSNFCSSCGAPLDVGRDDRTITFPGVDPLQDSQSTDDDVVVNLADLPAGTGVLLVRSGPAAGLRVLLTEAVTRLGRHPDCEVYLDDITVSRRHVEIERTADGYIARDMGSLNGTYLNQQRIEEGRLAQGDELQVGRFRLVFLESLAEEAVE